MSDKSEPPTAFEKTASLCQVHGGDQAGPTDPGQICTRHHGHVVNSRVDSAPWKSSRLEADGRQRQAGHWRQIHLLTNHE
eukprot:2232378-Pyramimonas_sp.AAC.1